MRVAEGGEGVSIKDMRRSEKYEFVKMFQKLSMLFVLIALILILSAEGMGAELRHLQRHRPKEDTNQKAETDRPLPQSMVPLAALQAAQTALLDALRTIKIQTEYSANQSLALVTAPGKNQGIIKTETASKGYWRQWLPPEPVIVFLAVLVALFQEPIKRIWYHPNLEVTATNQRPDLVQINQDIRDNNNKVVDSALSYYLRILVANTRNETARNVEVYAKGLKRLEDDGSWAPVNEFPPMNFVWSNSPPPEQSYKHRVYLLLLPPKTEEHCDIAHIIDPIKRRLSLFDDENKPTLNPAETSLTCDLKVRPNNKDYIVGPGTYCLEIVVAAENAKAKTRFVKITVPGSWCKTEEGMRKLGLNIEEIGRKDVLGIFKRSVRHAA
jgi:hypothetical protein